jgi:hypothetical protein
MGFEKKGTFGASHAEHVSEVDVMVHVADAGFYQVKVSPDSSEEEVKGIALSSDVVRALVFNREIKDVVYNADKATVTITCDEFNEPED